MRAFLRTIGRRLVKRLRQGRARLAQFIEGQPRPSQGRIQAREYVFVCLGCHAAFDHYRDLVEHTGRCAVGSN